MEEGLVHLRYADAQEERGGCRSRRGGDVLVVAGGGVLVSREECLQSTDYRYRLHIQITDTSSRTRIHASLG